ncbi:O-antigen ligase family protein [Erythrobacter crassostreae]|uniref:O-antigen ligase family protein n=1 Tax=Erythrobacter crassostreae TaxID=2828328 RepID=A0A9X1F1B4_9SPHN|nr:O-antigen ligase family protein [Erythrobacter crassostrea]MBV7258510.1 O-antigen ligase family protein [Erythrobacter crassostrea]
MISKSSLAAVRVPMVLLAVLTIWMVFQLVPLPPSIWQALPERELIAELDRLNGLEGIWRPISYVPMRGWNAVSSLIVPISAALLLIALRAKAHTVFIILVGFGVIDAALGLVQITGGSGSGLYFYSPTNFGAPVGVFANENHSGVLSALTLLIIARTAMRGGKFNRTPGLNLGLAVAFLLVTLVALVSGSRAALGLTVVAYLVIGVMAYLHLKQPELSGSRAGRAAILVQRPRLVLLLGFLTVGAIFALLFQFDRAAGVEAAFSQDAFVDLRWRITPILTDMMSSFWLLGSGFGTFDAVYQIYEPTNFLVPAYVNQAHNDWAQWVIEGGLPAIVILGAFIIWIARSIRLLFARDPQATARCVFWMAVILFLTIASVVDYPLRTPAFQMVGIWLTIAFAADVQAHGRQERPTGRQFNRSKQLAEL